VVFQIEHNKALGPDGFIAEFYQNFWGVIKTDLMELLIFLHVGQLELSRLNLGEIVLLPMMKEDEHIHQCIPKWRVIGSGC
jgi:hypothetical protein